MAESYILKSFDDGIYQPELLLFFYFVPRPEFKKKLENTTFWKVDFFRRKRTEKNPVSKTPCSLVFTIQDDGKSTKKNIPSERLFDSLGFKF
jgi:hypothetical protein